MHLMGSNPDVKHKGEEQLAKSSSKPAKLHVSEESKKLVAQKTKQNETPQSRCQGRPQHSSDFSLKLQAKTFPPPQTQDQPFPSAPADTGST